MTTYWAPLLHIYQPPTQEIEVLKRIDKECYKPLFTLIEDYENAKFCLNVNGILIELLYEFGLEDTMELLKNLVSELKVEIVGTGKFHPILPLIPPSEAYHQIQMNEELNRRIFGDGWQKNGFFPPEMAISPEVARSIKDLGYKWVIMSGIACPEDWPYDKIYTNIDNLQLFFRDDILSNKISFKQITAKDFVSDLGTMYKDPKTKNSNSTYIITAMDGETFGHHIRNYEKTFLGKVMELINEEDTIEICFISELDNYFQKSSKKFDPIASSWSTTYNDIKIKIPYPLWKHPDNDVHKYYWKIIKGLNNLMALADNLDITKEWMVENHYKTARWFYNRGLHSCPAWWANPLSGMWSPNLIYKGIELLMKAALNAQLALEYAGVEEGESYFDAVSYYHGLLLMELYNVTRKTIKKK